MPPPRAPAPCPRRRLRAPAGGMPASIAFQDLRTAFHEKNMKNIGRAHTAFKRPRPRASHSAAASGPRAESPANGELTRLQTAYPLGFPRNCKHCVFVCALIRRWPTLLMLTVGGLRPSCRCHGAGGGAEEEHRRDHAGERQPVMADHTAAHGCCRASTASWERAASGGCYLLR